MRKVCISTLLLLLSFATNVKAQSAEQHDTTTTQASAQYEQADSLIDAMLMQNLPEVMVKGERPIARLERGKLTYNMQLLLERIPAENAFDALRNIPGVSVNDDEVNFAGQTITLIINGKATTMTQEQVIERLKMIPASQLAKAEVMISAPPYYHVRGAAINIETRSFAKQSSTAGQILAQGYKSKYGSGAIKANLLHTSGKLMLDASLGYYNGKTYSENNFSAVHPLGDERIPYTEYGGITRRNIGINYRLGADYRFAEKHLLSVAYNGSWTADHSNEISTGHGLSDQGRDAHILLHNIDADYSLPFGLHLFASYLRYENNQDQKLIGTIAETSHNLLSNSEQKVDKWLVAADQQHDLGQGWGLSYGAKAQFTHNKSGQKTTSVSGDLPPESTSSVDNNERIVNGYVGFSKQFSPKLSLEATLTAEHVYNQRWNDWRVYPTLNLLWQAHEKSLFNLSVSSDATYPSYWSTMSNVHYTSVYTEVWGNPDLRPSHEYNITLMWQWLQRYTFLAFAMLESDNPVQLPYQPSDRMAVIWKFVNFDHRNYFGLQASAQYRAEQWLNGNVTLTGMYTEDKCDDFYDIPFDRSKFVWIASGSMSALLSKKANLRMTLHPFLQSNSIQGVNDLKSSFSLHAALSWASNDGRWNVSVDGRNLTNRYFETISRLKNQNYKMSLCNEWRNVALNVTYKFGDYKEKKRRSVDTSRLGSK